MAKPSFEEFKEQQENKFIAGTEEGEKTKEEHEEPEQAEVTKKPSFEEFKEKEEAEYQEKATEAVEKAKEEKKEKLAQITQKIEEAYREKE